MIHPYLIGRELVNGEGKPARYLIDFEQRDLFESKAYSTAFKRVEEQVLYDRRSKAEKGKDEQGRMRPHHKQFLERWWTLSWDRADMLAAMRALSGRCIAASRTQRWPYVFIFIDTAIRPGDKLQLFLFDDDYSFAILQGVTHCRWYKAKAARLKNEDDYNYSSESVFDTFPWPQSPDAKKVKAVADAGCEVRRVRADALRKIKGGLRAVYHTLELPGKNPLKDAHAALDAAVLAAYGFSPKKDILHQLLDLNLEVAARIDRGEPVTAPGIPPDFPNPKSLITEDCIRPAK